LGQGSRASAPTAVSDAEGQFSFSGVEPGSYRLLGERSGFLRLTYGAARPASPGKRIEVRAGQTVAGLEFQLIRQAVIAGRVVDEEGEPVERALVSVLTSQSPVAQGRRAGGPRNESTDDRGEFRIFGLEPGKYFLVIDQVRRSTAAAVRDDGQPDQAYAPTYFPGVLSIDEATPIDVGPGQEVTGLYVAARRSFVYAVRGEISGAESIDGRISVNLMPRGARARQIGAFRGAGPRVDDNGAFEFGQVQPGSYFAVAVKADRPPALVGRTPVEVTNADVDNVEIQVAPPFSVSGTARFEGASGPDLSNTQVSLLPVDGIAPFASTAPVQEGGSFTISNVGRDRYIVTASRIPSGVYLKAVRLSGQSVPGKTVDLTAGAGELQLVFSDKAATVEGLVERDRTDRAAGVVLLVPDPYRDEPPEPPPIGVPQSVGEDGRFTLTGVPPGQYRLYAFEDFDPRSGVNPDLLNQVQSKSERLVAAEGDMIQIHLKQVLAEDLAGLR
jgi:hypothetical protein